MKKQGVVGIAALVVLAIGVPAQVRAQRGQFGGGFGRLGAVAMGTVRQIDPAKNAIQVQTSGPNGQMQWVMVNQQTSMSRQMQATLADLKPNDTIVVSGVPTSINATQLSVGEVGPQPFGGQNGPALGGPQGGAGAPGAPRGQVAGGPGQPAARVTGTIVTTNPLVVALPGNIKLTVNADRSTPVTKTVAATLADVKVGDTILAFGQADDNGAITATRVNVGVDLNSGLGGFGGGFRGFGGGRRQRGGPGGGQQRGQGGAQQTL